MFQFHVFIRDLNCTSLTEDVVVDKCNTRPLNHTRNEVAIYARLLRKVEKIKVRTQLFRKSSTTFKPFLLDATEDYCQYTAGKGGHFVMGLLINKIKDLESTSLPKCPVHPNVRTN